MELAVSHNGACAAKLVVQDAVLEGAVELAVRSLLGGLALLERRVLEGANLERGIDGGLAAVRNSRIGSNALLDSLA